MARCQARSKRSGVQCKKHAVPLSKGGDGKLCQMHGGRGSGRPATKNPGGSKFLPKNLQALLDTELGDPELLSHRENTALLGALKRAEALLLSEDAPAELWAEASELYEKATKGKDVASLARLGEVLRNGRGYEKRLDRIVRLTDEQRKHREAENRRLAQLDTIMTARQANLLVAALLQAVLESVNDPKIPRQQLPSAIGNRFTRFMRPGTD